MVAEPDPEHLAYTGTHLHHHTGSVQVDHMALGFQIMLSKLSIADMNYREKSPGMQLLHCLKVSE